MQDVGDGWLLPDDDPFKSSEMFLADCRSIVTSTDVVFEDEEDSI